MNTNGRNEQRSRARINANGRNEQRSRAKMNANVGISRDEEQR